MVTTTYKGYELMATGTQTNTWGQTLNTDVFTIQDRNVGGRVTKSLTNANVTLTAEESQNAILFLTGAMTGNVTITTLCQGFFFVDNQTTGSFTVTIRNSFVATSCVAPQGGRVTVISDQGSGCRIAGTGDFPTGTRMPFNQTSAPTGWTKDTSSAYNDAAIRLTTGSVSTSGSTGFNTVFSARSISQANIPSYSLSASGLTFTGNNISFWKSNSQTLPAGSGAGGSGVTCQTGSGNTAEAPTGSIGGTISSGGSGTPLDFSVKYVDFVIAVKN